MYSRVLDFLNEYACRALRCAIVRRSRPRLRVGPQGRRLAGDAVTLSGVL
jgi:hypothetical protein